MPDGAGGDASMLSGVATGDFLSLSVHRILSSLPLRTDFRGFGVKRLKP